MRDADPKPHESTLNMALASDKVISPVHYAQRTVVVPPLAAAPAAATHSEALGDTRATSTEKSIRF